MANEKRLIDANALIEEMKECAVTHQDLYCNGYAKEFINNAPTVDAVEVVRCKDCRHRGEWCCPMYYVKEIEWDDDGYTEVDYVPYDRTMDDGFCDRGERKDNG